MNKIKLKKIYFLILLSILITKISLSQTTYYVSTYGSDSNTGLDSIHPWLTLNYAEAHATIAGDTIALRAGDTFNLSSTINFTHSGSPGNHIVWDGQLWGVPGDTAIIKYDGVSTNMLNFTEVGYITIENIVIDGNSSGTHGIFMGSYAGSGDYDYVHDITIQNCDIRYTGKAEYATNKAASVFIRPRHNRTRNIQILNNKMRYSGAPCIDLYTESQGADLPAYYSEAVNDVHIIGNTLSHWHLDTYQGQSALSLRNNTDSIFIENNILINKAGRVSGITIQKIGSDTASGPHLVVIKNNYIETDWSPIEIRALEDDSNVSIIGNMLVMTDSTHAGYTGGVLLTGPEVSTKANVYIYNNTIMHKMYGRGIFLNVSDATTSWEVKNNIIYSDDSRECILTRLKNGQFTHSNNLYFNSSGIGNYSIGMIGGVRYYCDDVPTLESGGICADPLFADVNSNWHLQEGSPAIGKGVPIEGYTEDIEGAPVPDNSINLGCYQTLAGQTDPHYVRSVVEDMTPGIIQITFDLYLDAGSIPPVPAFAVTVNGTTAQIDFIQITGRDVFLTLVNPVKPGDEITLSYTKPATHPLRSVYGRDAPSFSNKRVDNNLIDHNRPPEAPIAVIRFDSVVYSGFTGTIDASRSYDPQDHSKPLSFVWEIPDSIPVSSRNASRIQFLAPMVKNSEKIDFFLQVSNGDSLTQKHIPVRVLPYHPELPVANMKILEASDSAPPHNPGYILDQDFNTWWAANGLNEWITFQLKNPFRIHHFEISFQPGQQRSSYFDIETSVDSLTWTPILSSASCNFSGKTQVFPFPEDFRLTEYKYLKLIGKGNSQDAWNAFSGLRIRGTPHVDSITMIIYPNPASNHITISFDLPAGILEHPESIRWTLNIINMAEFLVYQDILTAQDIIKAKNNGIEVPLYFSSGVYVIQVITGPMHMIAQKLVIIK